MGLFRRDYIIGFLFILGFVGTVMGSERHELTDADVEVANVIVFAQFAFSRLPEDVYAGLVFQELRTPIDREALDTLVSLGVPELHAQFVCNYFLAQNLEYPGELIVLSSQSHIYSHGFLLPQDSSGLEIVKFWDACHHDIIGKKQRYYLQTM